MLIDRLMPEFDATRIEHRVVAGRASDAYAAAVGVDFVDAVRQSHALRGLLAVRAQTERLASVLRRSGSAVTAGGPEALRLADLPEQGEWVRLGADPPNEIVFGVVGRFWAAETVWERIDASDFGAFARPGYAKIAANFSFRPYGEARTLVSGEARTRATDALLAGVFAVSRQGDASPADSRRTRGGALDYARPCLTPPPYPSKRDGRMAPSGRVGGSRRWGERFCRTSGKLVHCLTSAPWARVLSILANPDFDAP
jgi:hypothetical protein